ncbi:glycosyltransferase [Weissella paramesenteroides]|uniref:glycosyltransferase family 2 protein n=1 Tax=Weissella sagaensis TaxID=2559928 RepID=UPI0005A60745|nr:glycosyltransferase family 2 protein [Weissella sagaensis]KAA8431994.1 glycosyltransferase [Weissella paramesenteroides]KAA8436757.1 glycosyltransferase [Weissella paramesenteroides]QDJ58669.1 glycosyltransferase [Weissella hellenica]
MTVSAVVVTYNRLPMLKEVIAALQNSDTKVDNIIIVDNNSEADTQEYLTSLGNQIRYVRLPENIGGAGGFNKGVRYFMEETDDDYVWLMDDDTVPTPSALTELLKGAKKVNNQFGFLASDVRWTDNTRAKMNLPFPINRFKKIPLDATEMEQLRNATFVSVMFTRQIVAKIGLPVKEFFIWGDDIEYTERAARQLPGYMVPTSRIIHKMAQNVESNVSLDSINRVPRYFYAFRNRMYFSRNRGFIRFLRAHIRIAYEMLMIFFNGQPKKWLRVRMVIKGVVHGWFFHPSVEYAKNKVKE